MSECLLFRARKRRHARFGKYNGKPATVLYDHPNGRRLVLCGEERFSAYADELIALAKPLHGSPQNWTFNNDGSLLGGQGMSEVKPPTSASLRAAEEIAPGHLLVDEDCWFSCPLAVYEDGSPGCCNDEALARGTCDCGRARVVTRIALALDSSRRAALGQAAEIAENPETWAGWGTGEGIARAIAAAIRALMEGE